MSNDINQMTLEQQLDVIKDDPYKLKDIEVQDTLLCTVAVRQNGYALRYVKNQTEEICMEAVKQDWHALQYVENQTEEICMEAVKQHWYALKYVENQTEEIFNASKESMEHKNEGTSNTRVPLKKYETDVNVSQKEDIDELSKNSILNRLSF